MQKITKILILKKEKAITLIALVVTIIVLLILAGVTINFILGENGIITKVLKAKREWEIATQEEENMLNNILLSEEGTIQEDIMYKDSLETISNPDRGFYVPVIVEITESYDVISQLLQPNIEIAKKEKISLIHLRINIGQLSGNVNSQKEDKDFSEEQLNKINDILKIIRKNKMKAIIRFAYDFEGNPNKEPTNFARIERHIQQLSSIFTSNKDIISAIEAGMIGPWGEMHTSSYAKPEFYKRLIKCYLENTSKDITINVRTLGIYQANFGNIVPDKNNADTREGQYRIGIFNDGYLANDTDRGTYQNRTDFINFMQTHGTYTMYGGEVTKVTGEDDSYSNIKNCSVEMPKTHTTYLNSQFNLDVIDTKWKTQTYSNANSEYNGQSAFKYINDHLGYRMVIRKSVISKTIKQGDICKVNLNIENVGFANVISNQKVTAILQKGNKRYEAETDIDIRKVESGKITGINFGLCIPNNIELGEWNIYLKISNANNTNYNIRFANPNIYNYYNANFIGKITIEKSKDATNTAFKQAWRPDAPEGSFVEIEDSNEWRKNNPVIDNSSGKIYMKSDEEHLYLSCTSPSLADAKNVHLRIDTKGNVVNPAGASLQFPGYGYFINNQWLYRANDIGHVNEGEAEIGVVTMKKGETLDYEIPLFDLNIASKNEVKALNILLLDAAWAPITTISGFVNF